MLLLAKLTGKLAFLQLKGLKATTSNFIIFFSSKSFTYFSNYSQ